MLDEPSVDFVCRVMYQNGSGDAEETLRELKEAEKLNPDSFVADWLPTCQLDAERVIREHYKEGGEAIVVAGLAFYRAGFRKFCKTVGIKDE